MNSAVKDLSLDNLVEARLGQLAPEMGATGPSTSDEIGQIRSELDAIRPSIEAKVKALQQLSHDENADPSKGRALDDELRVLKGKRYALSQRLNKARDQQRDTTRSQDAARRQARQDVIADADIICSTLSGSGHDVLQHYNFETVIIDEAAQAVELSALIPLKYQCRRCIMVGGAFTARSTPL